MKLRSYQKCCEQSQKRPQPLRAQWPGSRMTSWPWLHLDSWLLRQLTGPWRTSHEGRCLEGTSLGGVAVQVLVGSYKSTDFLKIKHIFFVYTSDYHFSYYSELMASHSHHLVAVRNRPKVTGTCKRCKRRVGTENSRCKSDVFLRASQGHGKNSKHPSTLTSLASAKLCYVHLIRSVC